MPALLMRGTLSLLAVSACALGCTSALPAYLLDPVENPHPRCDPQTHAVAVGESSVGRADAEQAARARLLSQEVGSKISGELQRIAKVMQRDGATATERSLEQRIVEKIEFSHGELIKNIGAPAEKDGKTYALACMNRSEAGEALSSDLAKPLAEFNTSYETASSALARGDLAQFTAEYRTASEKIAPVLRYFAQIRAIVGASHAAESKVQQEWLDVSTQAQKVVSRVMLDIKFDVADFDAASAPIVQDALRSGISSLGLAMGSNKNCTAGSAVAGGVNAGGNSPHYFYTWTIKPEAQCKTTGLGHACSLRYVVEGGSCIDGGKGFSAELTNSAWTGLDHRDEKTALNKALKAVTPASVAATLRTVLRNQLPLDD